MKKKRLNSSERNIKILKELYDFRLLTIDQLVVRFSYTKATMYHYISRLIKSGFVVTGDVKGFTNESGIRGRYYKISNKGITLLKKNGYPHLKYVSADLKVSDTRVPIEILFNDIHYELTKEGWRVYGSRESKEKFGINRGDNLTGVLSSPVFSNEYPFYIFQFHFEMSDQYTGKIISEVNRYLFNNIVFFTTTKEMFMKVVEIMLDKAQIYTYSTFRVLPLQYGLQYMLHYAEGDMFFNFLEDEYDIYKIEKEEEINYEAEFDHIVIYNDKEYYLANFLDFNLVNIHKSKYYRKEHYEKDGRKILALINDQMDFKERLANVHHIEYVTIPVKGLINYIKRKEVQN